MMKNKSLLEKNTGEIINYLRSVKRYLSAICFKDAIYFPATSTSIRTRRTAGSILKNQEEYTKLI